jgi:hypothetical protein
MSETISVKVKPEVKSKIEELAQKSELTPEFLSSIVLSLFAEEGGTVWTGIWSEGKRVVVDMPTKSHFTILKIRSEEMQ